ncbi:hypothetical protein VTI28DRAFT_2650 [Corynascus sepedonium]
MAVDFGTTYSAIAYVALEGGREGLSGYLDPMRIRTIQNYPDDATFGSLNDEMRSEVPTEVIYPLDRDFRKKEGLRAGGREDQSKDVPNHGIGELELQDDSDNPLAIFGTQYDDDQDQMSIDEASLFRWGYGAHELWGRSATHADPRNKPLARFKLLLDNTSRTEAIRNELNITLQELKRRRIIRDPRDVIVDFLTCLLRHAKAELENAGFDDSYKLETILCVPAIWSQKACRDMQTAMAKAMGQAGFPGVDIQNNNIDNLFIVSEPEAAAAFVLANSRDIEPGDTFVLLDAGGGTVDANTYTVSATTPLRLTREVVPPGGGLHGSSYINENFRTLLRSRLANETYLENEDVNGSIERIMFKDFEYRIKRTFNCYAPKNKLAFDFPGLRPDPGKGFSTGTLNIPASELQKIFLHRMDGIKAIMEEQIDKALEKDVKVHKVILIGGFAGSVSLRKYLSDRLKAFCQQKNCPVPTLLHPPSSATAVARGAVLRAFNKEQGPRRYARSSYGILRTEIWEEFPEHKEAKVAYDPHDGLPYVFNTIDWVLKLGHEVEPVWTCAPFLSSHTFDCWPVRPLICREVLYVSDRSRDSHYQLSHPKNAGAERVGEIVVDFTFLRNEGLIHPVEGGFNRNGKPVGKRHYRVTYTMVMKVVDRDLQCYAIYDGRVRKKCKINIASAFQPGVK